MTTPWGAFTYTYDAANRLTSITNPQNLTFTFTYDAAGRRTKLTYPNGIVTSYTYDNAGQVLSITATRTSDQVIVSSIAYTYDSAGNRTSMTDGDGTHSYTFDSSDQLVSVTHPTSATLPVRNEVFTYDAAGNRLADSQLTAYNYDNANRMTRNSSFVYTYDADGNQTSKLESATGRLTTYTYDSQNLLIGATLPDGSQWGYLYDAQGRRIGKLVGNSQSPTQTYFYDQRALQQILDGSGGSTASFTNTTRIPEPLAVTSSSSWYSMHADAIGSIVRYADQSGNAIEQVGYEAFGSPVILNAISGSTSTFSITGSPILFAGSEWDFERHQYNNQRRQTYDPDSGRFSQADPVGIRGGDVNFYRYVANQPTKFTDPTGTSGQLSVLQPPAGTSDRPGDPQSPIPPPGTVGPLLDQLLHRRNSSPSCGSGVTVQKHQIRDCRIIEHTCVSVGSQFQNFCTYNCCETIEGPEVVLAKKCSEAACPVRVCADW